MAIYNNMARERAVELAERGLVTPADVAHALGISRSLASLWLRETEWQAQRRRMVLRLMNSAATVHEPPCARGRAAAPDS